jgi:serine/threonine protein kinase
MEWEFFYFIFIIYFIYLFILFIYSSFFISFCLFFSSSFLFLFIVIYFYCSLFFYICLSVCFLHSNLLTFSYPLERPYVKSIFHQMLLGLEYLHSLNIIHRDIKVSIWFRNVEQYSVIFMSFRLILWWVLLDFCYYSRF